MNFHKLILLSLLLPLATYAKISDAKISESIETFFQRNRLGPELVSAEVMNHFESGRTIKVKIIARRNQSEKDLVFAFAAAAAVAHYADRPIEMLWVDMDINFKDSESVRAIAPANCTIAAIILKEWETERWWEDCMQIP